MRESPTMEGWIDEVEDGWVYGRYAPDGLTGFVMPLLDVPECQRVDLAPGMYCTFVNGNYLLIHKTIWSSYALEKAHDRARLWAQSFTVGQAPT